MVTDLAPELRLATVPGQFVGVAAGHADRRVVGWDLLDLAAEADQCFLDRLACRGGTVARRQFAVDVVGRRARAEGDQGAVFLLVSRVVLDEARGMAQEDGQDARRRTGRACRRGRRALRRSAA